MTLLQRELKERYVGYNRLPNLYQEVEYIESDGNAYVNLGILAKDMVKINLQASDFVMGSSYADRYSIVVFGTVANSWWCSSTYYTYQGSRFRYHIGLSNRPYFDCAGTQSGTKNVIEYTLSGFTVNGTSGSQIGTDNSRPDASNSAICFWYCGNNSHSKYKMYSLKITTTDGEHNYIPCYRKSDDVIGLYSIEDEEFYTNAGTGTFTKGNDVLFKAITEVYIGNGDSTAIKIRPVYTPNENTIAYYKFTEDCLDYSGNGYDLTNYNNNVSFSENGASFSGNQSLLKRDISIMGTGDKQYTIALSFKTNTITNSRGEFFSLMRDTGRYRGPLLSLRNTTIQLDYNGLAGGTYSGFTAVANQRYRAVFVHRTSRINDLYINGNLIGTVTMSNDANLAGNRMDIGDEGNGNPGSSYFNGYMRNMIFENGAWTQEQINQDYMLFPND